MNLVITNETQEQRQKRGSNSKERPSRKGGTQAATNPGSKNPPQKLPIRPNAKSKTKESSNQSNGFIPNKSNNARYDSGKSSRSKVSRVARLVEHEYKIWSLSKDGARSKDSGISGSSGTHSGIQTPIDEEDVEMEDNSSPPDEVERAAQR